MSVRAVFVDVGETLVDETRSWAAWADWLGVPHLTFFAVLGGVIERGEHHQRAFEPVRPGVDDAREEAARARAGAPPGFAPDDLHPDALPCLQALRAEGYLVASSADWGVAKPSPAFFACVAESAEMASDEIAYVGDRLDHDVLPAVAAGMVGVFLRRGPWGFLHAERPEAARADVRLDSLATLPALRRFRSAVPTPQPKPGKRPFTGPPLSRARERDRG